MDEKRLVEIKERTKRAIKAPWHTDSKNDILVKNDGRLGRMIRGHDAEFVANARQDIPDLVSEVERLRKALEFYANKSNYKLQIAECWEGTLLIEEAIANEDSGEVAREALNWQS